MATYLQFLARIAAQTGPITQADLLTNKQYNSWRTALLSCGRAQKGPRRLRLDENLSLLFETRMSVWLQIQEELRWLDQPRPDQVEDILTRNNHANPIPGRLTACLFVDGTDATSVKSILSSGTLDALSLSMSLAGWKLQAESTHNQQEQLVPVNYVVFKPVGLCSRRGEIRWTTDKPKSRQLPALLHNTLIDDLLQTDPRSLLPDAPYFGASTYGRHLI